MLLPVYQSLLTLHITCTYNTGASHNYIHVLYVIIIRHYAIMLDVSLC